MRKILAVGLVACAIAGTSLARAQAPASPQSGSSAASAPSNAPTAEDFAALGDARLAALKIGLKLKPDQEKSWTSFEATIRDLTKQRQDRVNQFVKERQEASKGQATAPVSSPGDILRVRAKSLTQAAADLTRYADAIDVLYKSLDDEQKRRMPVLMAGLSPR